MWMNRGNSRKWMDETNPSACGVVVVVAIIIACVVG